MTWQLFFVLNNLAIREPFASEFIAICGPKDARVRAFLASHPSAASLMSGFKDIRGNAVDVSALMIRDDAPEAYKTAEAIYGFRNVYAICSIAAGLQEQMRHHANFCTTWSTYFDFYPVTLDKNNDALVTNSLAVHGWDEAVTFQGQPAPEIVNHSSLQPQPDPMLREPLLDAWRRHVENLTTNRKLTVLFRSLEVAYQAAALPRSSSMFEHGSLVALWVSAIETLAHPPKANANLGTVLDLLDAGAWHDKRLRGRRYVIPYAKQKTRRRFIGTLYRELYKARNDFLHGNVVSVKRLFPFKRADLPPLPRSAALVYKAALLAFLEPLRDKRMTSKATAATFTNAWERRLFEECVLMAGGVSP